MYVSLPPAWRLKVFNGLMVVCAFSLGCGGETQPAVSPVRGHVMLNGVPVEGVDVTFELEDFSKLSIGRTNDKGEYKLSTFKSDDGAIVGDNFVTIREVPKDIAGPLTPSIEDMQSGKSGSASGNVLQNDPKKVKDAEKLDSAKSKIPSKYANPKSSGLKRTVVAGAKNEFDFELKP